MGSQAGECVSYGIFVSSFTSYRCLCSLSQGSVRSTLHYLSQQSILQMSELRLGLSNLPKDP